MRLSLLLSLAMLAVCPACSPRSGQLVSRVVQAPSLATNLMGISARQRLAVYLPPSYGDGWRRFPVLYFLPNFKTDLWRYTGGNFQGFRLKQALDKQIALGAVEEMIVVVPNSEHFLGGSFYRNSPLTGNWEDYITRDVVDYVDWEFRTVRSAKSRCIAGHGVGGTGALELALKHPEVFGSVYAMSPALFDPNGLRESGLFSDAKLAHWHARLSAWARLDEPARRRAFRDYIQGRLNSPSREKYFEGFMVAYAAATAPDPARAFPYIALPEPGGLMKAQDPDVLRLENGFGGWREKLVGYLWHGARLDSITIERGKDDEYPWLRHGTDYLSELMLSMRVPNALVIHEGGHEDTLGHRLETGMLPSVSQVFRDHR